MCIHKASRKITVEFIHFSKLTSVEGRGLVQQAIAVRNNAQAPYSHFKVGAALCSDKGGTFYGCNVERADYSGTTHAEQAAIDSMVSSGHRKIAMIVLAAAHEDLTFDLRKLQETPTDLTVRDMIPPCGGCLQKIWENCLDDPNVKILSVATNGLVARTSIGEIFPISFDLKGVY